MAGGEMISQLRVYVINRERLDDFVAAWASGVYPLRRRHGFEIPHVWINRERNEFIWVLTCAGPERWEDMEAAYYNSQERAALDPDPRQYIAQANQWFISPVALPASADPE
jgi:hypothetical protein